MSQLSFSWVCPVTDNEFHHNIVKVVWESTWLLPDGSTATLINIIIIITMLLQCYVIMLLLDIPFAKCQRATIQNKY